MAAAKGMQPLTRMTTSGCHSGQGLLSEQLNVAGHGGESANPHGFSLVLLVLKKSPVLHFFYNKKWSFK